MSSSIVLRRCLERLERRLEVSNQFSPNNWHPLGFCAVFSEIDDFTWEKEWFSVTFLTYCQTQSKMWVTRFMSLMTISSPIFSERTKEPNPAELEWWWESAKKSFNETLSSSILVRYRNKRTQKISLSEHPFWRENCYFSSKDARISIKCNIFRKYLFWCENCYYSWMTENLPLVTIFVPK